MTAQAAQAPLLQIWKTARAGHSLTFLWAGGPYIDVHSNGQAVHSINVWDYSTGQARYPYSGAGTRAAALEWLQDTTARELDSYSLQAAHSS